MLLTVRIAFSKGGVYPFRILFFLCVCSLSLSLILGARLEGSLINGYRCAFFSFFFSRFLFSNFGLNFNESGDLNSHQENWWCFYFPSHLRTNMWMLENATESTHEHASNFVITYNSLRFALFCKSEGFGESIAIDQFKTFGPKYWNVCLNTWKIDLKSRIESEILGVI